MTNTRYCPCCGRIDARIMDTVYKLRHKNRTYTFCSYSCFRKIQKLKENKQYEEVDRILAEAEEVKKINQSK